MKIVIDTYTQRAGSPEDYALNLSARVNGVINYSLRAQARACRTRMVPTLSAQVNVLLSVSLERLSDEPTEKTRYAR